MNSVAGNVTQAKRLTRHLHRLHLTEASDGDASEMRWVQWWVCYRNFTTLPSNGNDSAKQDSRASRLDSHLQIRVVQIYSSSKKESTLKPLDFASLSQTFSWGSHFPPVNFHSIVLQFKPFFLYFIFLFYQKN